MQQFDRTAALCLLAGAVKLGQGRAQILRRISQCLQRSQFPFGKCQKLVHQRAVCRNIQLMAHMVLFVVQPRQAQR
jgi:hypothetical protein